MNQFVDIKKESISAIFIIALFSLFILANLFGFYSPVIFFVVASIGSVIAFLYPRSGVAAIVFLTFIFERFFTLQPIVMGRIEYKIYPLDFLLMAVLASFIISIISKRDYEFKKADKYLIGFVLLTLAYFIASIAYLKTDFSLSFSTLKNYAFYPLVFFVVAYFFDSREKIKWLLKFALAGAISIIYFIFYGIISGNGLWSEYTPLSTEGVRTLAFTHAFYLSMSLVALLVYILYASKTYYTLSPDPLRQVEDKASRRTVYNKFFYLLVAVWMVGIIGSMMRHLWGSLLIVACAAYFVIPKELRKKYLNIIAAYSALAVVAVIIFMYLALMFPNSNLNSISIKAGEIITRRVESLGSVSTDESFSWRSVVWKEAAKEYLKSPILGVGLGKKIYTQIEDYKDYVEIRNIHNSYLVILVQMGIPALILLSLFAFEIVKEVKVSARRDWIGMALSLVLIGLLVDFVFQPYLETNLLGIFFWVTLGLLKNNSQRIP